MDFHIIRDRVLDRIEELGLAYKDIDKVVGRKPGWFSGLVTEKQQSLKSSQLAKICKFLAVSEAWLRNEDINSPSLFVVAPPPPKRAKSIISLGAGRTEFIAHQLKQVDEEIVVLKDRLRDLQEQRKKLIEAKR